MGDPFSLVYPLTMPERPGFRELTWGMDSVVAVTESPFTLAQQVIAWPGQRWTATVKLPAMVPELAREWFAFFAALNGREGTFYLTDSSIFRIRETAGFGEPQLDGDHEAGRLIFSRYWPANQQGLLQPGDILEIGGRLRRVLHRVDSDVDQTAQFHVWPAFTAMPDETPIEWRNPRGIFRLLDPPEMVWGVDRLMQGLTFACVEALS